MGMRSRFMLVLFGALLAGAAPNALVQKQVTYNQVVMRATPTMTLSASASTIQFGTPLTLSATLASGGKAPTGQVSFLDGGASLAQGVSLQAGESGTMLARYTASSLAAGVHTITASYTGDANYLPATSVLAVVVNPIPGFTISATPVRVVRGSSTGNTSTITVTAVGNFTGTVSLAAGYSSIPPGASGLPALTFSSGNPATLTTSSPRTAVLTISTIAPSGTATSRGGDPGRLFATGGAILVGIAIFCVPRRRPWQSSLEFWLLFAVLSAGASGCMVSGPLSNQDGTSPTPPGTYVVAITGASGTVIATGSFTLTVQ